MNKSKKITLSIALLGIALVAYIGLQRGDLMTRVVNIGNTEYYESPEGEVWLNQTQYDEYEQKDYYMAPDGTYWINEYRYDSSQE